ncbi:MAG TPA: pyridoxamine 5'-phosphate oxidase family protein [Thermoplasmata archaeon]|nr:pyridoxamine 5'-phosphate oxidase family protein [Thermoplasmata archaeon]
MGEVHSQLPSELQSFLGRQHVFFVATAPLSPSTHINVSPKGLETLKVLSSQELGYLDLTGSGNETSAHILENGRITIMLCAFEGPPNVLRIYGQGSVHLPGSPRWKELRPLFPDLEGARQIVTVRVERVQTSCGYAVPLMEFKAHRTMLTKWAAVKGAEGLEEYRTEKNETSIDGLATHRARQKQSLAAGSPP